MLLQDMPPTVFHWLVSPYLFRRVRKMDESKQGSQSSQQQLEHHLHWFQLHLEASVNRFFQRRLRIFPYR